MFTLALNRLALLQAQNQVAFLLFFSYLASDTAKPNPQGKFNALHIGSLNRKREKKIQKDKKRPHPHTAKLYGLAASTLLPASREVEGSYLF